MRERERERVSYKEEKEEKEREANILGKNETKGECATVSRYF